MITKRNAASFTITRGCPVQEHHLRSTSHFASDLSASVFARPQEHYCIVLGINDRDGCFAGFGFQEPQPEVLRLPGGKEIQLN